MLQTIEVEIDSDGRVHPLEPLPYILSGRAYLTLLPPPNETLSLANKHGSAAQALELLASERYAQRPRTDVDEVQPRIEALRNDWGER